MLPALRSLTFTVGSWPWRAGLVVCLASTGLPVVGQTPTFAPALNYDMGTNSAPSCVLAADVNGDRKLDLLTANYDNSTIGVQLGTGRGTFQGLMTYSTGAGSFPRSVAVADVNGDGLPDLLTANSLTHTVGVLLGTGTGSFGTLSTYSTGAQSGPVKLVVADVNGDGVPDLLTANSGTATVGLLLGTGTGSFEPVRTYSTGVQSSPLSLAVADVNGDGRLDLLTANSTTDRVGVLLGTATGGFGPVTAYSTGLGSNPFDLAVADVNGDGQLDVLTANSLSHAVGVLLGTGTGSFGPVSAYGMGVGSQPQGLVVADLNGDGKLDVVTADTGNAAASILLGTGTGSFGPVLSYSAGPGCYPQGIAVAELNGDGKPDILTANPGHNTVGVLLSSSVLATRTALSGTRASLYPNPTRTHAKLTVTDLPAEVHRLEATWYNALGQALGQLVLPASASLVQAELPTDQLPAGVYLLQLRALDAHGTAVAALPSQRLSIE